MTDSPVLVKAPDALGEDGRAQMVANALLDLQQQEFALTLNQIANQYDDEDNVPGLTDVVTFGERRQKLRDAQRRLQEAYSDLMPKVVGLLGQEE